MPPQSHDPNVLPMWAWLVPVLATALLAALWFGLLRPGFAPVLLVAAILLGAAVFASVHHAEILAHRLGEPFGSIVLALAVTVIEVALIVSLMLAAKNGIDVLARDTVFATVMIVLNGIVGLCLMLGGIRHHEQKFSTDAATAALSVLGTLSVITLILPNYTLAAPGPVYSPLQLAFVGIVSGILYCVFLFVQTVRHPVYFHVDAGGDDMEGDHAPLPSARTAWISLGLLGLSLVTVVLLAKTLSPALERAIFNAGLPTAFIGVVIAGVVLLPEGIAAVRAAFGNRLQQSLNLALGSAMATIGMTIPAVAVVALLLGNRLTLGLAPTEMVLLILTIFTSTVTLATGRTTILQGAVHLVIFAVFLLFAAVP